MNIFKGGRQQPPLNKQKKESSKRQWGFIGAGLISLCILAFVLVKTYISPSTTQSDRALAPRDGKSSSSMAEKKSPEAPNVPLDLPKDENPLTSRQALNREPYESKQLLKEKKSSLTKQMPKEEIPSKLTGEEPQGAGEMDFPIGIVISQGNVKMEVKDRVWRMLESPYSPILKGKKIKIENGTARISLSNNSLIEVSQNSLLSFEHEGQLNLLEGGIHFKIPAAVQMNFKIGALSVTEPHPLATQRGSTTPLTKEEETEGSLFLHPDGSLRVRPVEGSLSILDHENRVLTITASDGPITITPKMLSGQESWRAEQLAEAPAPEMEEKFQAARERSEVSELEKYLIEFSIHLKGKELPVDLDAQKFFSLLEAGYPNQDHIEKVKEYPVSVRRKGESYVLTLCDKQSEWRLYEDLGETTHRVDQVYDPDERTVRCREAPPPYWLLTIPAAAATGVVVYEIDKHNDHKDRTPLCP